MAVITITEAMRDAIGEELERDPNVIVYGEDVELSVYGAQNGLVERFGRERIWNAPLSEATFVGAGLGAAMSGVRPVIDLMIGTFTYVAMDQLYNQAAKLRYMSGGQAKMPVVVMCVCGARGSAAAQHSDSPYPLFMSASGIKVVLPSTPADAKGLLKASIRDDNPVLFFEPLSLLGEKGEVPDEEFIVPLGRADIKRHGDTVTIVGVGATVKMALEAATMLAAEGIEAEVVDVRTLRPLDENAILESVRKTGRLVVADEARQPGLAAEVSAIAAERAFDTLRAPIARVFTPNVPVPFSPSLEGAVLPSAEKVAAAARRVVNGAA